MRELLGRTLTSALQDAWRDSLLSHLLAAISFGDSHFGRTSPQVKEVGMAASKGRDLPLYHMTL